VLKFKLALGLFLISYSSSIADIGIPEETPSTHCKISKGPEGRADWTMEEIEGLCHINESFELKGIYQPWASIFVQGLSYADEVLTLFEGDLEIVEHPEIFAWPNWAYLDRWDRRGILAGTVNIPEGILDGFHKQNITVGIVLKDFQHRYIHFTNFPLHGN
jgi:hypothetical protein